jgi:hypothetical protein
MVRSAMRCWVRHWVLWSRRRCIRLLPRWGSHRLVPVTVAGYAVSGPLLGVARSQLALFLALTSVGFFLGGLDVAMNVQAAAVERASPRDR